MQYRESTTKGLESQAKTWLRRPPGKLEDSASRTRLDTLLVASPPRPKIPELFNEFAVFLELFALVVEVVEVPVVAPVALRLATAAKVSKRDTALGSRPWDPGP